MEIPSQAEEEGEIMPLPLNSTYSSGGHAHMIHHHHHHDHDHTSSTHIIPSPIPPPPQMVSSNGPIISSSNIIEDIHHHNNNNNHVMTNNIKRNKVKYKECLKNHAAAMGGNATDGCGEFMPSGEEGTLEALTCSACNCHRNFHRKEIEGDPNSCLDSYNNQSPHFNRIGRKVLVGHHHHPHHLHNKAILGGVPESLGYPMIPSRAAPPPHHHHPMIMSYNMGSLPSESDDQEEGGGVGMARVQLPHHHNHQMVKKRFRTKFSQEQKEKMLNFAEKAGWKIQKQEEAVVQQFCQEVGIKRRVLKVWMHNNKLNLAKKNNISNISPNQLQG